MYCSKCLAKDCGPRLPVMRCHEWMPGLNLSYVIFSSETPKFSPCNACIKTATDIKYLQFIYLWFIKLTD